MKVPEYIKDKMRKVAKYSRASQMLIHEIDDYFIDKGYDIEDLRSGDGKSLEELEYGNDVTDKFCDWIENEYEK